MQNNTALHVSISGKEGAPNVALVHGWGMNSAVWGELLPILEASCRVYCIDLPGHGKSPSLEGGYEAWVSAVADVLPSRCHYIGWSLGGLVGLGVSERAADQLLSFTMIASTPYFMASPEWPALPEAMLDQFSNELQTDLSATIKMFLALQFYGMRSSRTHLRALQRAVLDQGDATSSALEHAVGFLREIDKREQFKRLKSVAVILGGKDKLVPVALADLFRGLNENASVVVEPEAGHAPFVSHPQWVADTFFKEAKLTAVVAQ